MDVERRQRCDGRRAWLVGAGLDCERYRDVPLWTAAEELNGVPASRSGQREVPRARSPAGPRLSLGALVPASCELLERPAVTPKVTVISWRPRRSGSGSVGAPSARRRGAGRTRSRRSNGTYRDAATPACRRAPNDPGSLPARSRLHRLGRAARPGILGRSATAHLRTTAGDQRSREKNRQTTREEQAPALSAAHADSARSNRPPVRRSSRRRFHAECEASRVAPDRDAPARPLGTRSPAPRGPFSEATRGFGCEDRSGVAQPGIAISVLVEMCSRVSGRGQMTHRSPVVSTSSWPTHRVGTATAATLSR
jgi:hypothetical protein